MYSAYLFVSTFNNIQIRVALIYRNNRLQNTMKIWMSVVFYPQSLIITASDSQSSFVKTIREDVILFSTLLSTTMRLSNTLCNEINMICRLVSSEFFVCIKLIVNVKSTSFFFSLLHTHVAKLFSFAKCIRTNKSEPWKLRFKRSYSSKAKHSYFHAHKRPF